MELPIAYPFFFKHSYQTGKPKKHERNKKEDLQSDLTG